MVPISVCGNLVINQHRAMYFIFHNCISYQHSTEYRLALVTIEHGQKTNRYNVPHIRILYQNSNYLNQLGLDPIWIIKNSNNWIFSEKRSILINYGINIENGRKRDLNKLNEKATLSHVKSSYYFCTLVQYLNSKLQQ